MKLTKEQKDKLEALKTTAEIRAFFEAESIELNPFQLIRIQFNAFRLFRGGKH